MILLYFFVGCLHFRLEVFVIDKDKFYISSNGNPYFVPFQKKQLEGLNNVGMLVLAYLYRYKSVWGNVLWLSMNHLISWSGYSGSSKNKSRNINLFKKIMQSFIDFGWIELVDDISLDNIKPNDTFCLVVNTDEIPVFNMDADVKGGYVKFTFEEMDGIRLSDTKLDIGDLVCSYLATKQFIAEDSSDDTKSAIPNDYKCKIAHPTTDYLMGLVDIKSSDTMNKYMDELVRLGLLFSCKAGTARKMKNGGYVKFDTPTCYALEERFLVQAADVLKEYYGVDAIYPYNEGKDKPPINHNPVRPNKDKINDVKSSSCKRDMNPFHEDSDQSDIEDEMPFDTSGMNPVIKPYKPFNGFYETMKDKIKPIENQSDREWLDSLEDDLFEIEKVDDEIDINSISDDEDDAPDSIRLTRELMEQHASDNMNDHDMTDEIIADMTSGRRKKDISPAEYMRRMDDRLEKERIRDDFAC